MWRFASARQGLGLRTTTCSERRGKQHLPLSLFIPPFLFSSLHHTRMSVSSCRFSRGAGGPPSSRFCSTQTRRLGPTDVQSSVRKRRQVSRSQPSTGMHACGQREMLRRHASIAQSSVVRVPASSVLRTLDSSRVSERGARGIPWRGDFLGRPR